jgi:L-2-hydroxyglutarate oxidase LhgO
LPTKYGLGIHAGFDIDGSVRFGPDTFITSKVDYTFEPEIKKIFVKAIKDYWPSLNEDKLHEDYVGIRPKIQRPDEKFADFSILGPNDHQIDNCIFLQGIESPGLTCSLSIANYVSRIIKK